MSKREIIIYEKKGGTASAIALEEYLNENDLEFIEETDHDWIGNNRINYYRTTVINLTEREEEALETFLKENNIEN